MINSKDRVLSYISYCTNDMKEHKTNAGEVKWQLVFIRERY
jgi:hypothetical protein